MFFFDRINNTVKSLGVYVFGRGLLSLTVMGVGALSVAMPTMGPWVLPLVALGGVVLSTVNQFYSEYLQQNEMVDLYRHEIAKHLGIDPQGVTRAHLKEMATQNEVLAQAMSRTRKNMVAHIATSLLSSAATVALVMAFGADSAVKQLAVILFGDTPWAGIVNYVGISTVAGLSGLVFNHGVQEVLRVNTGLGKASAHDRIMEMQWALKRGHEITKEQVYGVLVASDTGLQEAILHRFGKRWRHMKPYERSHVLVELKVVNDMELLAAQITNGDVTPGRLAFLLHEADEMLRDPLRMSEEDALAAARATRLVISAPAREAETVATPSPIEELEAAAPARPANSNERPSHVERLGRAANENAPSSHVERLGLSAKPEASFREQVEASRQQPRVVQI